MNLQTARKEVKNTQHDDVILNEHTPGPCLAGYQSTDTVETEAAINQNNLVLKALKKARQIRYTRGNESTFMKQSEVVGEAMVSQVLNLSVNVAGVSSTLQTVFHNFNSDDAVALLHNPKLNIEVTQLLDVKSSLKLDGELPIPHPLYIPRRISNRLVLDPNIFRITCRDVFVFTGIDTQTLTQLVTPYMSRSSTTQRARITCRHIYLDDDEDWDDLGAICKTPIHLILKEGNNYILHQSTQVTDVILENTSKGSKKEDAYVSEDVFVDQFLSDNKSEGVLIWDVPGMGKTWFMQSIANKLREKNSLVFYVSLQSFSDFCQKSENQHIKLDAIELIFNYAACSNLGAFLIHKHALKNGLPFIILLDGFDEIRVDHVDITTSIREDLNAHDNIRLIISSRPHMRAHLEKTFGVISYDILPFGREQQVNSIVAQWRAKFCGGDQRKLVQLADQCIHSMSLIQKQGARDILGIPLRCYILAAVNETYAKMLSCANPRKPLVVDEGATVESVYNLYERFVNSSVSKLLEFPSGDKGSVADLQARIMKFHTHKALELLFPEIATIYAKHICVDLSIMSIVTRIGLLLSSNNSRLDFIHRSFAEYFTGKFFAEFWNNIDEYDALFVETVGVYFLKTVLTTTQPCLSPWLEAIKLWESGLLRVSQNNKVVQFKNATVLWFMNNALKFQESSEREIMIDIFHQKLHLGMSNGPKWKKILLQHPLFNVVSLWKSYIRKETYCVLLACIDEGLIGILSLYLKIVKSFYGEAKRFNFLCAPKKFCERGLVRRDASIPLLLSRITATDSVEAAQELFIVFDDCLSKYCKRFPNEFWSPIEFALTKNHADMALYFQEKVKLPSIRLFETACLKIDDMTDADVHERLRILENLTNVDIIKTYVLSKDFSNYIQSLELSQYDICINILTSFAFKHNVSLRRAHPETKRILLKVGLKKCNDKELVKLLNVLFGKLDLNKIPRESLKAEDLLDTLDLVDAKETFLLIKLGFSCVFRNLHDVETLKVLVAVCPDVSLKSEEGKDYLHYAVEYGKIEWIKYLIKSGHDVNRKDKHGRTPFLCISHKRSMKVSLLLIKNGADVYAVNEWKMNAAHRYQRTRCLDNYMWVKVMIEKGYHRLWDMKDETGVTPFQLLSLRAGKSHPVTITLQQLLGAKSEQNIEL